jgi:phospholipid/cholesterol/gamma-HCH transport system substrate-binding protein
MNEKTNKRAVIVGIFVFVGLVFLLAGILTIGNLHETFQSKIKLVALFDDVSGLQAGNNVWFSGVKIGTVSGIKFYGKSQVIVTVKVEKKAQPYIRKNARAKVGSEALIGNKIIVIYGGSSVAGQAEEGDTLGVEPAFSADETMNTLQENNKNLLSITGDIKILTRKLVNAESTVGKLLNDSSVYNHLDAITASLEKTSLKTQQLMTSLADFSDGFNRKGTLANELVTDTVVFASLKNTMKSLQQISDTAIIFMATLKNAAENTGSPAGVLLHDKESGAHLKQTILNLDIGSKKLNDDLEAAQHNFLLKGYFKKKAKQPDASSTDTVKQSQEKKP